MAESSSGGIGILGVIIGAAIVLIIGFFLINGNMISGNSKNLDVTITPPASAPK